MPDRIDSIRRLLEKTPDDVFLHYSLAMEYAVAGNIELAVGEFDRCIALDADYLAAYVECGKALRASGRLDQARQTFARGAQLAQRLGDRHVQDYIQQQLEGLGRA